MTATNEVWVVQTHRGWGEEADVMGVYATEEAARAALEKLPNMTVTADDSGYLRGEGDRLYAKAEKYEVES